MADLPLSPFITDPDNRFVLDEEKFMFDLGYVPPAARPENFAKFMAVLDAEIAKVNGIDPADVPAFLGDPSPEYMRDLSPIAETIDLHPRRFARG